MNISGNESEVVELFEWIDKVTLQVQQLQEDPYLDSLAIALELLCYGKVAKQNDKLKELLIEDINLELYKTTSIHKAVQLAILKGMQKTTQHKHLMTPETIALLIGYLVNKLTNNNEQLRVFDPAAGTGNLLLTVLKQIDKDTLAYGSEVDPTLIKIALLSANLQKKEIEFFHQDSLRPILLDPVDIVVSDLPVGYYPDDIVAAEYELQAESGHSFAHYLFLEQSLTYTKPGGFLIFVIPHFLFSADESGQLQQFIQKYAHIIGVIQINEATFKTSEQQKSILILRKKSAVTKNVKQPLLVMLPSFKESNKMASIIEQMNEWFNNNEKYL